MALVSSFKKPKRGKKGSCKRKELEEASDDSNFSAKAGIKEEKKMKNSRLQLEMNEPATEKVVKDAPVAQNREKKRKKKTKRKIDCYEERERPKKNSIISDARFVSAHSDPRFQRMPKREAKVPIDSRFARMLSDRSFSSSSAPVDKRGKPRKGKEVNPLLNYYLHEEEPEMIKEVVEFEEDQGVQEEDEQEDFYMSSDEIFDKSSSSTDDEDEEDDQCSVNSDLCQYLMADHKDTPVTELETHRLAVVNMDWDHIKAVDLYVVMSSCLPKGGQVLSVSIYPSEFGLKSMEIEAVRGPTCLSADDEERSDDEPDPEVINEKLRAYELNKLRYYFAVAVFDSSATANYVYNTLDGTELTRTSNVFDLRFIDDTMEFKHPPRDATTEAPTAYKEPDFHTLALQHSKVKLTWEADEPQRLKTLRRKFNADKLDDLSEYLASSTDDSDDEDNGGMIESNNDVGLSKDKSRKRRDAETLRALLEPNNSSDTDDSANNKDMEITFNTGLEDLSKRILEKKDKKVETVWEQLLRRRIEKRKARKKRSKYSSDDDGSDSVFKAPSEQQDDFFVEESSDADVNTVNKEEVSKEKVKHKKAKNQSQQIEKKEQEASRAELELLFAEDQGIDQGPKGYNMKSKKIKGKNGKLISAEEKLPNVDFSKDPRFAALLTNHVFALDPTDPQYKRSAAYARQQFHK